MVRTIIIALGAVALAGCATSDRVDLIAGDSQEAIVRNGAPALVSRKRHLVMLSANARAMQSHARPSFTVAIRNMGTRPETLTMASFTAASRVGPNQVAGLRIYQYEDLVKEEQNRQTVRAVATALSGAANTISAANAGYVTTTGSISGNAYGQPYSGTYSSTTYDPYRAQMARQAAAAQTASDFATLRAEGEANLARLNATILKDHTVMPGEWYGGVIVLDVPLKDQNGSAEYTLTLPFGGEVHEFRIRQARMQ